MDFIIKDINKIKDIGREEVGGKAFNLITLKKHRINVPKFFVVTSNAFTKFLSFNNIDIISENKAKVKDLIENGSWPEELSHKIQDSFEEYQFKNVAVRSSACVEDSLGHSFAGQFETYLSVGQETLLECIQNCWGSLFSAKTIAYMPNLNNFSMAVIIQDMITATHSGVSFTANPANGNREEMVIESIEGIGKLLVDGEVTPDMHIINKGNLSINKYTDGRQEKKLIMNPKGRLIIQEKYIKRLSIDRDIILALSKICLKIEKLYNYPVDIEWAIDQKTIFIIQSRLITTINKSIK